MNNNYYYSSADKLPVLDKGYVRRTEVMGSDLTVADAARVSYDRTAENYTDKQNEGLIAFLGDEGHTSPFRHAAISFEIYAPLMSARQIWKYIVGSSWQDNHTGWNESSRRYITEDVEFYLPQSDEWRKAPENSKQGSGDLLEAAKGYNWYNSLYQHQREGLRLYEEALEAGIAAEQARLFLPAYGLYVRWRWVTSLQGVAHFLNERLEKDAQKEVQAVAQAVYELAKDAFPIGIETLVENKPLKISRRDVKQAAKNGLLTEDDVRELEYLMEKLGKKGVQRWV